SLWKRPDHRHHRPAVGSRLPQRSSRPRPSPPPLNRPPASLHSPISTALLATSHRSTASANAWYRRGSRRRPSTPRTGSPSYSSQTTGRSLRTPASSPPPQDRENASA